MRLLPIVLLALAFSANASTISDVTLKCPIGGETFTATLAGSGTQFGVFLDFKPYGPIIAPWPVAVCPTTGFVMYKHEFSKKELIKLTKFVNSQEYRAIAHANTPYYLAAKLRAHMGEPIDEIAHSLLKSTWEAEPPAQYERYAKEALATFTEVLKLPVKDKQDRLSDELITGELERRLGYFTQAQERFARLAQDKAGMEPVERAIIELQLSLIEAKNSEPKHVPGGQE